MHLLTRALLVCALLICTCGPLQAVESTVVKFEFTVGGEFYGEAYLRLFDTAMPRSVDNFKSYLDQYDGTFIHRNPTDQFGQPNNGFVVQGGGVSFVPPGSLDFVDTGEPILDEPGGGVQGMSNLRGTLSNAKSGPDTVTSQWFVNLSDNSFLDSPTRSDGGFAAFGRVLLDGMEVFDNIDALPKINIVNSQGALIYKDVPVLDPNNAFSTLVTLSSASIVDLPDGDYNLDGVVDSMDYAVWRESLGSTTQSEADGNGDGVVDGVDFDIWQANYGANVPSASAAAAPEPGAAWLCLAVLVILGPFSRRACKNHPQFSFGG